MSTNPSTTEDSEGPKATVRKLKQIQNLSPHFVDLPQTPFAFYGGCHKGGPWLLATDSITFPHGQAQSTPLVPDQNSHILSAVPKFLVDVDRNFYIFYY